MQNLDLVQPLTPQSALMNIDVLALIADSVICTDEDGRIVLFNRAAEQAFGYSASEVIGRTVEMLLPRCHRADHIRQVRSFAEGHDAANRVIGHRREVRGRRKNGEEFPAEAMVSRHTIDGRTILTVVHRDITGRKELDNLREAAARELDHRMRNVLSVVNSLVLLSAANAVDVEDFKESLMGRLKALAATQNVLRSGEQQAVTLSELFLAELVQYRNADGANFAIEGPPVSVGPRAAQMLSLAAHELATNSAKYGVLRTAGGRVDVNFAFQGEADETVLVIEWRETGGPVVEPPRRRGFGTTLIKQVVARALSADVVLDYLPEGLVCRMTMPRAIVD